MYVDCPTEGRGSGISTSHDGDCDPPTTMGHPFADHVCHRESLRSQTVKDVITPDEQTTRLRLGALAVCFVSLLGNCQVSEDHKFPVDNWVDPYSCECFIIIRVNNSKFCPSFYRQDLLSFDSLSRDWILKLEPNDNFRNEIINLDYPWVMTPLSNTKGNFSVYVLTVVRWRGYGVCSVTYSLSTNGSVGIHQEVPVVPVWVTMNWHEGSHSTLSPTWTQVQCPVTVTFSRRNSDKCSMVNQKCSILDHHTDCVPLTGSVVLTSGQIRRNLRNHPDLKKTMRCHTTESWETCRWILPLVLFFSRSLLRKKKFKSTVNCHSSLDSSKPRWVSESLIIEHVFEFLFKNKHGKRVCRVRKRETGENKTHVLEESDCSGIGTARHWVLDQNHPQRSKERGGGVSNGRATADWGK
jgi:hypothetical protein